MLLQEAVEVVVVVVVGKGEAEAWLEARARARGLARNAPKAAAALELGTELRGGGEPR